MVEIPDELIAETIIAEAKEYGEFDVPDAYPVGEYGQDKKEVEWSLNDINPSNCDVDMNDNTVVIHAVIQAKYSVKTARRTFHHPAEYKTKQAPLGISIERELGEMAVPRVYGEFV